MKVTNKEYLIQGDNYFPNTKSVRSSVLPSGAYECKQTMDGIPYFSPIKIVTDKIVDLPNSSMEKILAEIKQFWSEGVSTKFEQYGLVHKRGIGVYGTPGSGKTIIMARVAQTVIEEFDGVVLFNPEASNLPAYLRLIKDIEPNKKIAILWEEFDDILRHSESTLLSLLDGEIQVGNIIYLATTNYISKIPSRIKNRPSRFAKWIEIGIPGKRIREAFLKQKLHESDLHLLPALLQASDGFVIDQVKDLIVSVCCFGHKLEDAVRKIKEMQQDSMGIDDYHEENAKKIFKSKKEETRVRPLNPIK